MKYPDTKLIIFARAPVSGEVKTRLIPALGPDGAAQFYQRMAHYVIESMQDSRLCDLCIDCLPDSGHAFFLNLLDRQCIELNKQTGDSLGERMANSIRAALNQHRYVILIGTDAPCITPRYIESAIEALRSGSDVVIGPAQDGGYVLIGVSRNHDELFTDIDWSTSQVLRQTLAKARHANLLVHQLPVLWDVDIPNDLDKIRNDNRLAFLLNAR